MSAFTVNTIFDFFKERRALVNPDKGGYRFDRRERVEFVFPEKLCREIASRSPSYYSWFLNMDRQAVTVRDLLRRIYDEDSYEVVQEMVDKCGRLLGGKRETLSLDKQVWKELLDLAGREIPLFVRGSDGAGKLQQMTETSPQRALACLFLAAGMDGLTPVQYEQMENCWRLLNRVFLTGASGAGENLEEPQRRLQAGELLLLDGNREEALRQFEQAAEKLRTEIRTLRDEDHFSNDPEKREQERNYIEHSKRQKKEKECREHPEGQDQKKQHREHEQKQELLGRVLLHLGNLYMHEGNEDSEEKSSNLAIRYLRESAALGFEEAYEPLAALNLQNGAYKEAREILQQGAQTGVPACLRMLGNAYYRGDETVNGRRDLRRAVHYYVLGARPEDPASGDDVCQYMLGRILEEAGTDKDRKAEILKKPEGEREVGTEGPAEEAIAVSGILTGRMREADYWYAAAARLGNADAAARLNRLRWNTSGAEEIRAGGWHLRGLPAGRRICLLNSRAERNLQLAKTLPEGAFSVIVCSGQSKEYVPGEVPAETAVGARSGVGGKQGAREKLEARENQKAGERSGVGENLKTWNNAESGPRKHVQPASEDTTGIGQGTLSQALFRIGRQYLEEAEARAELSEDFEPALWLRESFPEIVCAALDEDEQKNIRDGLRTLQAVYLLHEQSAVYDHGGGGERGDDFFYLFSGRVKLYVAGRERNAAPVFDSAFSRMGDFYIQLFLYDPEKMASAWLLDRLPLFIPCLGKGKQRTEGKTDVIVFGDHPGIVQLCKDIIAVAQIEDMERFPFSLTVVGEGADLLKEQLLTECPGIVDPPKGSAVKVPLFIHLKPESHAFQQLLSVRPAWKRDEQTQALADRLQGAGYLIVYAQEERRNLSLAMYLREWYLKTDPTFTRLPFIAAYCERTVLAEQMRTLTAGAEEAGFGWHNNYRIEPFGTQAQLFSYDALVGNRLEQRAQASHFAYYSFTNRKDRFRAEHDYFSRNYNRDSSVLNALSLPYRLFSAGIAFADWHDYLEGVSQERLAQHFEDWLKGEGTDKTGEKQRAQERAGIGERAENRKRSKNSEDVNLRLERLAAYEHGRWNRALLSRGWMPASVRQMLTYIQRGNARQQLYIAKLHPFLCSWDQLGEAGEMPGGIQGEYNAIMRQVRPDWTPVEIRQIDRENVLRTAQILRSAP